MSVLDVSSGVLRGKVSVGPEPEGVTVRPDGKVVFVTSEAGSEVTAVDTASLTVVGHMPTGPRPRSVLFTPDGAIGFVTDEFGAKLTVVDAVAFTALGEIPLHAGSTMPSGPRPMGEALSPDGKTLYVTCGRGGSVAVIDVATRTQVRSIDGVGDPSVGDRRQHGREEDLHRERDLERPLDRRSRERERREAGADWRIAVGRRARTVAEFAHFAALAATDSGRPNTGVGLFRKMPRCARFRAAHPWAVGAARASFRRIRPRFFGAGAPLSKHGALPTGPALTPDQLVAISLLH